MERRGRGFCAIGVEHAKTPANIGTLWRSAYNLDASFIFTVGARYRHQPTDLRAWRHIPLLSFSTVDDLREHMPHSCVPIGVELTDDAQPLERYEHPPQALYLLGPEDGSLSGDARRFCRDVLVIGSRRCLNVATAGSIVLYDRLAKAAA